MDPRDQAVLDYRYVDNNKKPISATQEHPYAEFKMMPIRMSLKMDQRKIPKLLVECANSTMPVEVHRIQVNSSDDLGSSRSTASLRGPSPGPGMPGPGMPGPGMPGPGMPGMGMPGMMGNSAEAKEANIKNVPVEIVGIIYIYKPPDPKRVGTGAAMEETAAMPGAPAIPEAVVPGATPPEALPETAPADVPANLPTDATPPTAPPVTAPATIPEN
jgi:hypothetical protein